MIVLDSSTIIPSNSDAILIVLQSYINNIPVANEPHNAYSATIKSIIMFFLWFHYKKRILLLSLLSLLSLLLLLLLLLLSLLLLLLLLLLHAAVILLWRFNKT